MEHKNSFEPENKNSFGRASKAMRHTLGLGVALTMVASTALAVSFAIALDGCSSTDKNKNVPVSGTSGTILPAVPNTNSNLPDAPSVAASKTGKKKSAVWVSTISYKDAEDGVSFRYPRTFKQLPPLTEDGSPLPDPLPMNFVQPGGVTLATIGQTGDPSSSFFKVSVNRGMTQEKCFQFSTPSPEAVKSNPPVDPSDGSIPVLASVRGVQYSRVENATEQTDVKYFHHFVQGTAGNQIGACYEFALGVEEVPNNTKPVDYMAAFDKLERILTTVNIDGEPGRDKSVTASVTRPVTATNQK